MITSSTPPWLGQTKMRTAPQIIESPDLRDVLSMELCMTDETFAAAVANDLPLASGITMSPTLSRFKLV